jgi:hypothetical protein
MVGKEKTRLIVSMFGFETIPTELGVDSVAGL